MRDIQGGNASEMRSVGVTCSTVAPAALVALASSGCVQEIEVPESKLAFVGTWSSDSGCFELRRDGEINASLEGAQSSRYVRGGALLEFSHGEIVYGLRGSLFNFLGRSSLSVSLEPYETESGTALRVHGVELVRQSPGTRCKPL